MNKKVGATVATLGVAATVLLTGTYAWQSLNQEALNEASAVVNPGGRLHDDFDYNNDIKRIYVENFGDRDIYARIKLTEYMEIGNEAGQNLTEADRNVELITTTANYNDKTTWPIYHYLNEGNETFEYWNFDFGGEAVAYLPTFNMNKDSLKADINGTYGAGYSDYVSYDDRVGEQIEGTEIKDNDTNTIEEENPTEENVTETVANHTVATTKASCVISMEEWNALDEATQGTTECWVYDTDGWAYWSKPIAKGTATGTLINDIDVKNVDDSWFYALNATAQFITADDLGYKDNTGFYDVTKGSQPTENALRLLDSIGVDITGAIPIVITPTADAQAIDLNEGLNLSAGNTITLSTSEGYADAKWTSSDLAVGSRALVDNGDGTATFTVPNASVGSSWTVTVTVPDGEGSGSVDVVINSVLSADAVALAEQINATEVGKALNIRHATYYSPSYYVIAKEDNKALMMYYGDGGGGGNGIAYAFDATSNNWEDSSLRASLNNVETGFLGDKAVLSELVMDTTLYTRDASDLDNYVTTTDKVFIMSEADRFGTFQGTSISYAESPNDFTTTADSDGNIIPNDIEQNGFTFVGSGIYYEEDIMWLRTPGTNGNVRYATTRSSGTNGEAAPSTNGIVLPMFWVDLSSVTASE